MRPGLRLQAGEPGRVARRRVGFGREAASALRADRSRGVLQVGRLRDNARMASAEGSRYDRIYAVVRRVPRGRVATYGQVARLAGLTGQARQVGYALHAMATERQVPWHRVINARGEVSARSDPGGDTAQRRFLEREGIVFGAGGRIDLERFQWRPRADRASGQRE